MAYNTSKGNRQLGDLINEDDPDTKIDFGSDSITLVTNSVNRVVVNNSALSASGQLTVEGSVILGGTFKPLATNTTDLGASGKKWKDAYVDGIGYIDQIGTDAVPSTAYINAGELDGVSIGSESPSTAIFTTVSGTTGGFTAVTATSLNLQGGGITNGGGIGASALSASSTLSVEGAAYLASTLGVPGSVSAAQVTASQGVAVAADDFTVSVGASADLSLYHTSNNSYIKNSVGHLQIDNDATDKHIRLKLGEDNSDTAVQIRNNSNSTVWGCDAVGNVSGSGPLTTQGITNCNGGLTVTGSTTVVGSSYLSGSHRVNYKFMVVDYALTSDDYIIIFNGSNKTATLPALSATNNGVTYIIKNTNATSLTVTGSAGGAGKIDNQQTKTLAQGEACWVLGFNNGTSYGWTLLPEK